MDTVKGSDFAQLVGSRDTVVRIGSRWYWVTSIIDPGKYGTTCGFATCVPQCSDPRLGERSDSYTKSRVIYMDADYPTRTCPAPVWDWVTRDIEREAAI